MKTLFTVAFALILLSGCVAGVQKSADTLKLTQASIVSIATATDAMCSAGALTQSQCSEAARLYSEAKGAYSDVLTAEQLVIDAALTGESIKAAEGLRAETMTAWIGIATKIITIAAQTGVIKEN